MGKISANSKADFFAPSQSPLTNFSGTNNGFLGGDDNHKDPGIYIVFADINGTDALSGNLGSTGPVSELICSDHKPHMSAELSRQLLSIQATNSTYIVMIDKSANVISTSDHASTSTSWELPT